MLPTTQGADVKVWDAFIRLTHWGVVVGFLVAYLVEDEPLIVHVWAGYIIGALVVARVVWGFIGPERARFSDFAHSPRAVVAYLVDLLRFRAKRYLGHSPAGGAMVILLLLGLASTVGTGLILYGAREGAGPLASFYAANSSAGAPITAFAETKEGKRREAGERSGRREGRQQSKALKGVHELLANLTLGLIILHIAGVLWASVVHRENLVRAMITGRKRREDERDRAATSAHTAQPRPS